MPIKTVAVPNISCGHCVATIERELGDLGGVRSVSAQLGGRSVTVDWDDATTSWTAIRDLLEEINYPAEEAS